MRMRRLGLREWVGGEVLLLGSGLLGLWGADAVVGGGVEVGWIQLWAKTEVCY